jgi:ubiquinone/menaquinone biosynthesis C-methylase UbiE
MNGNLDTRTVDGFGEEWSRFDQSGMAEDEIAEQFGRYFAVFPWDEMSANSVGFDLGCGSGRWAKIAAQRIGKLHCIDASSAALDVARKNLSGVANVEFHNASVDSIPIEDSSMDFGYSLGVLHHVPDTAGGIRACVNKLKPGAPFLVYLYYAFDNRPAWFRTVWKASDLLRRGVCSLPFGLKRIVTDAIALFIYFPSAKLAKFLELIGFNVDVLPLSTYRKHSFYTMRTDALDRFGTRLEQRFTREQIREMMQSAGLGDIRFGDDTPYWCAVGIRVSDK